MKFGLTGDTHNNLKSIRKICSIFNSSKVDFVVHTGDITLPKSLEMFSELESPLIGVFGNNDQGDKDELRKVSILNGFDFCDGLREECIDEKKIIIVHDPNDIDESFYFNESIIVHGHTHRYRDEKKGNSQIFNPGECAGMFEGKNSIGIVSLEKSRMEILKF